MEHMYKITEENVDGKGTKESIYVRSNNYLYEEERKILQECLDKVKKEATVEDTEEKVQEALEDFSDKTGIILQPISEEEFIQYFFQF